MAQNEAQQPDQNSVFSRRLILEEHIHFSYCVLAMLGMFNLCVVWWKTKSEDKFYHDSTCVLAMLGMFILLMLMLMLGMFNLLMLMLMLGMFNLLIAFILTTLLNL